jgi:uncharacterized membrane protein YoaK (UPF0700 family)
MNAAAFVAVGTFVTHVTGFASIFGVHAARAEWHEALAGLLVPAFFLAGAMLAGWLVVVREEKGKIPHYDYAMAIAGICALAPALMARAGLIGAMESRLHLSISDNAFFMALLCLSSGIQNAALSAASHRSVRVTHMTGLTTDLGLGLARLFFAGRAGKPERKLSAVRLGTLASFLAGSVAGALASIHVGFDCFFIPGAICFYAALRGRHEKVNHVR